MNEYRRSFRFLKCTIFLLPTSVFRCFICRTRMGISVIIFSASKEIMVSMSRSIPHTCWMSLYSGCRPNHSFSFIRVISASQSFSFGSVPSLPGFSIESKQEHYFLWNNYVCSGFESVQGHVGALTNQGCPIFGQSGTKRLSRATFPALFTRRCLIDMLQELLQCVSEYIDFDQFAFKRVTIQLLYLYIWSNVNTPGSILRYGSKLLTSKQNKAVILQCKAGLIHGHPFPHVIRVSQLVWFG